MKKEQESPTNSLQREKETVAGVATSQFMIVICAFNEVLSLRQLLPRISDLNTVVVDDGSTDKTAEVAFEFGVPVIKHQERLGKAAGLRDGLQFAISSGCKVVVDLGADGLPEKRSVERLVDLLGAADVGGASAKQIPLQAGSRLAYLIDDVIWATLAKGKEFQMRKTGDSYLGAVMFAFKVGPIDFTNGVNDDEVVGNYLRANKLRVVYDPRAIVYFDASTNIHHILDRRVRMNFGHLVGEESSAPTAIVAVAAVGLVGAIVESKGRIPWVLPAVGIELVAKLWAWYDFRKRRFSKYSRWVTVNKGVPRIGD